MAITAQAVYRCNKPSQAGSSQNSSAAGPPQQREQKMVHLFRFGSVIAGLMLATGGALAATLENSTTIPHSVYVREDNPPCGDAGSQCRTVCVDYPWTNSAQFQVYMSGIAGRGPGNWTQPSGNASSSNSRWEWGASVDSSNEYHGSTGRFCSTGKNWSHNNERQFIVRVIY